MSLRNARMQLLAILFRRQLLLKWQSGYESRPTCSHVDHLNALELISNDKSVEVFKHEPAMLDKVRLSEADLRQLRRYMQTLDEAAVGLTSQKSNLRARQEHVHSEVQRIFDTKNVKEKKKKTTSLPRTKSKDIDRAYKLHKLRIVHDMDYAYVVACIDNGKFNQALSYLKQRRKSIDMRCVNAIIRYYSKDNNLDNVHKVMSFLTEIGDQYRPTSETFSLLLLLVAKADLEPVFRQTLLDNLIADFCATDHHGSGNPDCRGVVRRLAGLRSLSYDDFSVICKALESHSGQSLIDTVTWRLTRGSYLTELLAGIDPAKCTGQPYAGFISPEQLEQCISEQFKREMEQNVAVKSVVWAKPHSIERQKFLEATLLGWRKELQAGFGKLIAKCDSSPKHAFLRPFFRVLPQHVFVDLMLKEAEYLASFPNKYSPHLDFLHAKFGRALYSRYALSRLQKMGIANDIQKVHRAYCNEIFSSSRTRESNFRAIWTKLQNDMHLNVDDIRLPTWPTVLIRALGKQFYSVIINDLTISSKSGKLPAFYVVQRQRGPVTVKEVAPHRDVSSLFSMGLSNELTFPTVEMPMSCPPKPWTSAYSGGYVVQKGCFVRDHAALSYQAKLWRSRDPRHLHPALDALNAVGACPWIINTQVLDTVVELMNRGGDTRLAIPPGPFCAVDVPTIPRGLKGKEWFEAKKKANSVLKVNKENYSLWCTALYKLSIANHFREKVFWFPHDLDFRGRAYAINPYLSHICDDMARGLLKFATGKPLGSEGLRWLKIHLINLTGTMKRSSMDDRFNAANELMPEILDSAERPLTGKRWWQMSDDPWQTLACCMEIAAATRSPDPREFVSNFPVHQDGSCNGLQHYAALGRDLAGGQSVNLMPSKYPRDVYSDVVRLVEERREKDASKGVKEAVILGGSVKRKVIKQTIMTTVYGVTAYGAREQIKRRLAEIEEFPKASLTPCAVYLGKNTLTSLNQMFTATKVIQDWLTLIARLVSTVAQHPMIWITPLGFPVLQPYMRTIRHISHGFPTSSVHPRRLDANKQKNALPPNFIHSLDSSHMMLTAINCAHVAGISFVSVHDSFWTHAATVPELSKITREQFVALHKFPILAELSRFWMKRYGYEQSAISSVERTDLVTAGSMRLLNLVIAQIPNQGQLPLDSVLESQYFFS